MLMSCSRCPTVCHLNPNYISHNSSNCYTVVHIISSHWDWLYFSMGEENDGKANKARFVSMTFQWLIYNVALTKNWFCMLAMSKCKCVFIYIMHSKSICMMRINPRWPIDWFSAVRVSTPASHLTCPFIFVDKFICLCWFKHYKISWIV